MPSRRKRARLPVWTVRWTGHGWILRNHERRAFISSGAKWRVMVELGPYMEEAARVFGPCSVRIYGKNGRIQQERTYPRSADPRRSRG
jgi:hypothetical protein